jgi:hypothetical protein
MRNWLRNYGSIPGKCKRTSCSPKSPTPALVRTRPPIQRLPLDCSPGLKWPGCEADLPLFDCIKHRLDRITQGVVSILVLSFTMGIGSFPGAKRPGCGVNHLHPSTVEVKGKVDIYFYSQCVPSWQVTGCTLLLLSSLWNPRLGRVLLNTCRYTTAVSFCIPPDSSLINIVSYAKLNNFCCRQDLIRGHQTLKMEAASSSETSVTTYQ